MPQTQNLIRREMVIQNQVTVCGNVIGNKLKSVGTLTFLFNYNNSALHALIMESLLEFCELLSRN